MLRYFLLSFAVLGWLLGQPAFAALALDGSSTGACNTAKTSCTTTLTTASINDVIVIYVTAANTSTTIPTLNTPTATGLTFTLRSSTSGNVATNNGMILSSYYAIASSALSSVVITATTSASADTITLVAFGVSGANTSTPFDTNGSLPATAQNLTSTGTTAQITGVSTNSSNTMIIAGFTQQSNSFSSFPGPAAGYTAINYVNNSGTSAFNPMTSEYEVVSATQSSATVTWTNFETSAVRWFMLTDAIQQASSGSAKSSITMTGAGK